MSDDDIRAGYRHADNMDAPMAPTEAERRAAESDRVVLRRFGLLWTDNGRLVRMPDPNPVPYLGWRWLLRRTKRGRK